METTFNISETLLELIKTEIQKTQPSIYWDRNDELNEKQIALIIEGKADEVWNEIFENNLNNMYDLEQEHIVEALKVFKDEIIAEMLLADPDFDEDELNLNELADDLRDQVIDLISVDLNEKDLIRNTGSIAVRVVMEANHECLESAWQVMQYHGYDYKDSYLRSVVDTLKLNPAKIKKILIERGYKTTGSFPNLKYRDGKELVDYNEFFTELENTTSEGNKLVFVGKVDLNDFNELVELNEVVIPKGNYCGLFDSYCGAGSVIETKLLSDVRLNLNKTTGKSKVSFEMIYDNADKGYGINQVYGVTSEFWKKELAILGKTWEQANS